MSKPTIAIDIDEVIADGTLSICQQINDLNGTQFSPEDWHTEKHEYTDFYANFPKKMSLKYGIESLKSDMTVNQSHVPLKLGSKEALENISKDFDIILITARKLSWRSETLKWVARNVNEFVNEVVFSREHPVGPNKVDICESIGVKYLVDDRLEYLKPGYHSSVKRILFGDYAWHTENPEDIFHCKNWKEVEEHLERKIKD